MAALYHVSASALRYGDDRGGSPPLPVAISGRVAARVDEARAARGLASPLWPREARMFVHGFLLEATRCGASEDDVAFVRHVLTSPESYAMYQGDRLHRLTDEELLIELQALVAGLRVWMNERTKLQSDRL